MSVTQGLQVNKFETDVLGLKEEMEASLETSMNTGKFNHALIDAFQIQLDTIRFHEGERVEAFMLMDMNVYNDEVKIATIVSQPPPMITQEHAYYSFLLEDEDTPPPVRTIIEHRFTHVYVAMTVFALTIACLFLSYGCFMSRACRRLQQKKRNNNAAAAVGSEEEEEEVEIDLRGEKVSRRQQLNTDEEEDLAEIVEVDLQDRQNSFKQQTETIAF
jgi:hypothetical protein